MADNPLKKLVADLQAGGKAVRPSKANHTLYLREPQFRIFAEHCKTVGQKPSEVVDQLIAMFLAEAGVSITEDPAA